MIKRSRRKNKRSEMVGRELLPRVCPQISQMTADSKNGICVNQRNLRMKNCRCQQANPHSKIIFRKKVLVKIS
jgi:hypothetical protein